MLSSGNVKGLFQVESYLGKKWIQKLRPDSIELLSALIAIIRPGVLKATNEDGVSYTELFCKRRHGEEYELIDENIKSIMESTYDVLCYQEQMLKISGTLCGFNLKQKDRLRACITNDTQFVSKTRGWISIARLLKEGYKNDKFLIVNKNGQNEWKKIKKIWLTGNKATQRVESRSGYYVNMTKHHQVLTNDGWKARMRLSTNDYLYTPRKVEWDGQDLISEDMAIIIAGLLTEGYFVNGKKRSCHFTNFDTELMQIFSDAYFKEFGKINTRATPNVFGILQPERNKIAQHMKYGKSGSKEIPDVMMGMTLETTRKFLSFMFGCESGICKDGSIEYTSKSEKMIDQIRLLLLRFGIRSHKVIKNDKKYGKFYRIFIGDKEQLVNFELELSQNISTTKQKILKQCVQNNISKKNNYSIDIIPPNITKKLLNQYPYLGNYRGGQIYKNNITRKTFKEIANESNNKSWINFSNHNCFYDRIKRLTKHSKSTDVYDFTMADDSEPHIIANGMIIHNSAGKKDSKLMGELRKEFVDGAKQVGLISEDKANLIYDNIAKSARYLFNQSHSVSYALTGYITAYLKYHFPLQFYTGWLKHFSDDMDPQQELRELVQDARLNGIEINPPVFLDKEAHTYIKDGAIYLGLGDIKGIGEKSVEKLISKIKPMGWLDILNTFPTKQLENLIQAGAFGGNRVRRLAELHAWASLTNIEKKFVANQGDLLKGLELCARPKADGGACTSQRIYTVKSLLKSLISPPSPLVDTPVVIAKFEADTLGVQLSCTKTDSIDKSLIDSTVKDIQNGKKAGMLAAEIRDIKVIKVKKVGPNKGKEMAFVRVYDITGEIESTIFPDQYRLYAPYLLKGNTLVFKFYSRDGKSFIINDIWQI